MRAWLVACVLAGCAYDRPALDPLDGSTDGPLDAIDDAAPDGGDGGGGCALDVECASGICDAGACVPTDEVRYVAMDAEANPVCSQAMPCPTIAQARAAASASLRVFILVRAGTYPGQVKVLNGDLTIVGAGLVAPTISDTTGNAVDVRAASVTLRHLQLTAPTSTGGDALRCTNATVSVEDVIARDSSSDGIDARGCDLRVDHSQLRGNAGSGLQFSGLSLGVYSSILHGNAFGGAAVVSSSECALVGSVVDGNGNTGSAFGGVQLSCAAAIRVENVTFGRNTANDTAAATALACTGTSQSVLVSNVIFASNAPQLAGCAVSNSMFLNQVAPPGINNRAIINAGFVDEASGDLHITPTSVARSAGDPLTSEERDLDGELRPIGLWDVGADEIP